MKLTKIFASSLVLAVAGIGAGCKTHTTTLSLSSGYEEVSHPFHTLIDEPDPPRVSFQHRDANGSVTKIWPSLYGVNEVIKGDLAIFVGERGYFEPERVTHPRLFAVRSPDLPMDITDQVLRLWAEAVHKDFTRTQERFTLVSPTEKNGRLELRLAFWTKNSYAENREDWPEQSTLALTWAQVDEIVRTVKARGAEQKDLRWKTPFIVQKH